MQKFIIPLMHNDITSQVGWYIISNNILPNHYFDIANQVATLLNIQNKLRNIYTPNKILTNRLNYIIEIGDLNSIISGKNIKVHGFCGLDIYYNSIYIRHLSVAKDFKNNGLATKLLTFILNSRKSNKPLFMDIRSENKVSLHLANKFGFVCVAHIIKTNYSVLTLRRS